VRRSQTRMYDSLIFELMDHHADNKISKATTVNEEALFAKGMQRKALGLNQLSRSSCQCLSKHETLTLRPGMETEMEIYIHGKCLVAPRSPRTRIAPSSDLYFQFGCGVPRILAMTK
jgi:hypothetical protein